MSSIPWAKPTFFGDEEKLLVDALRSSWISGGEYITRLEGEIAGLVGCQHAIAVSNGTTALELALRALDIGPGDEVIVPAFTFVAPVNMVLSLGATPVYVDVNEASWLIEPAEIEPLITKRTKAVIAVHLYGNVARMDAILDIARRHRLAVIEDAAEAVFSRYRGKSAGTFGTIGTFSFQATKTITTGEGGMVVTGDAELARKMRLLRDHGMTPGRRYHHDVVGFNFRLTNLQAAVGCAQLLHLNEIRDQRARVYAVYKRRLGDIKDVSIQCFEEDVDPVVWAVAVRLNRHSENDRVRRDVLMSRMAGDGIETRPGFYSLDLLKPYNCPCLPVASNVSANVISLPTYVELTDDEILLVCDKLEKNLRELS